MNKKSLVFMIFLLAILAAGLQGQFARTYGGLGTDDSPRIQPTQDDGFIVVSSSMSFTGGGPWLIKLAADGSVQWEKTYSIPSYMPFSSVCGSPDGGYVMVGGSYSSLWLLKTDSLGLPMWQRSIANNATSGLYPYFVCQATDSGYFVVGYTGGGLDDDVWVIKVSSDGDIIWQRSYGLNAVERGIGAVAAADGGLVVAGTMIGAPDGIDKLLVFEIDAAGAVLWQRSFTSTDLGVGAVASIRAAEGGGFLLAGAASVLKLGQDGAFVWARTYPNASCSDIRPTPDGGSIVAGYVFSDTYTDMAVMKLGANGDIEWQRAFGGPFEETGSSIVRTTQGDYALAGVTSSFGAGVQDICVIRMPTGGEIGTCRFSKGSAVEAVTATVSEADMALVLLDTSAAAQAENFPFTDPSALSQTYALCTSRKLLTMSSNQMGDRTWTSPELGSHLYLAGATVTISATASVSSGGSNYTFSGWSGDVTNGTSPTTFELTDDTSVRANYYAEWGDGDDGGDGGGDWGNNGGSKGRCFVATAAYRSPLHPAVRLLRDFRDRRLLTNGIGRAFVAAYYRWSPPAARAIASSAPLRLIARGALVPVIAFAAMVLKLGWLVTLLLITAVLAVGFRKVLRKRWARAA